MRQRGSARGGWQGTRLAGIVAVLVSSVLVSAGAAAAGDDKGKPEPKATPVPSQGAEGNSGASDAPKPKPAPEPRSHAGDESKAKAPKPSGGSREQAKSGKGGSSTKSASRQSRDAGTGDNPQGRGPSGKTQYCHATHSETNPFVVITTNNNALWAHRQHQDEEDIIPATNGQCPGGTTPTSNPRPSDDGDPTPPGKTDEGGPADGGPDGPGLNGVEGLDTPPGRVAPGEDGPAEGDVLRASETSPAAGNGAGTAPALAEEPAADEGGSLPFTGLGLAAILAIALLALGIGIATHRLADRDGA